MRLLLQLIFILILPIFQFALGSLVLKLFSKYVGGAPSDSSADGQRAYTNFWAVEFLTGLLVHLYLVLLLKSLGLHWGLSLFLPLIPSLFAIDDVIQQLRSFRPRLSANFLLWFSVIAVVGISLFDENDGIKTIWRNNYGDLAFHLGMISSFAIGDNFPPAYHLFPHEGLSYPFLINLWTASLWWINPSMRMLSFIFFLQWLFLWLLIYKFLKGDKHPIVPWALLFGGGTPMVFAQMSGIVAENAGVLSHEFIDKGYPWTVFISTLWVTQRATILGLALGLAALSLALPRFFSESAAKRSVKNALDGKRNLSVAGFLLGLGALVHTHFMMTIGVFLVSLYLTEFLRLRKKLGPQERAQLFDEVAALLGGALLGGIFSIPFIRGKSGLLSFTSGWMPWKLVLESTFGSSMINSLSMWLSNCFLVLVAFLAFLRSARQPAFAVAMLVVFVTANLIGTSIWEWDQIKIFVALYLIFLAAWSMSSFRGFIAVLCGLLLIIPGLYETWRIVSVWEASTIYTNAELEQARMIIAETPADAIIAAKPDHNSIITLTGRKLFSGYGGTLHSHGLPYSERERALNALTPLKQCPQGIHATLAEDCPNYVLWTEREVRYWKDHQPGKLDFLKKTKLPYLYALETQVAK